MVNKLLSFQFFSGRGAFCLVADLAGVRFDWRPVRR